VRLVDLADAGPECGGKAYALGRLVRAGVDVPEGVVALGEVDALALREVLARLGEPLAVRSSGLHEDSASASFAGQLETVLGVAGTEAVAEAVERCARSGGTDRARAYARRLGRTTETRVPVIVQRLVAAQVAGVAFTREPTTGADAVVIEAARGLGESVVGGTVVPDRYTVSGGSGIGGVEVRVGSKATRVDLGPDGLRRSAVGYADRRRPSLTDAMAAEVAEAARHVEAVLGHAVDVEWAIEGDRLWVLQARPITTSAFSRSRRSGHDTGRVLVSGTGSSSGTVGGTARVVRGVDEFGRIGPGDILVCRTTDPAWTPLFGIVAAVVTETGGLLSHASIVAREAGIPAVVGAVGALSRIGDGEAVVVDGARGTVAAPARLSEHRRGE
jgi:pyruvate,water dikinase